MSTWSQTRHPIEKTSLISFSNYPKFEIFFNLPPRALKDYYQVIKDPLCIKKLRKSVRGVHGRHKQPTGVSEFKSWAAFEAKASLIWQNALFYNEDGSEIAELAKELQVSASLCCVGPIPIADRPKAVFQEQIQMAKAAVPDPPQPKIKIKGAPVVEATPPTSKRITIHVARGSSAESPAPATGGSASSDGAPNGISTRGNTLSGQVAASAVQTIQLDKARSVSAASPGPAVSMKREDSRSTPTVPPRPNGTSVSTTHVPVPVPTSNAAFVPQPGAVPLTNGHTTSLGDSIRRLPGRGMSCLPWSASGDTAADKRFQVLPTH